MISKSVQAKLTAWQAANVSHFMTDGLRAWGQAAEGAISDAAPPTIRRR